MIEGKYTLVIHLIAYSITEALVVHTVGEKVFFFIFVLDCSLYSLLEKLQFQRIRLNKNQFYL